MNKAVKFLLIFVVFSMLFSFFYYCTTHSKEFLALSTDKAIAKESASNSASSSSSSSYTPGTVMLINDGDFQKEVLESKGVVLVDVYATWCGPCQMQAPIVEKLAKEKKRIKFVKMDIDRSRATAYKYGIRSIPTLMIFVNGKKIDQWSAYTEDNVLRKKLSDASMQL